MFKNFFFSALMLAHVSLFANVSEGETLERQRWEYIKQQNWKELEKLVAPYFQAALFDGNRNKEQYMNLAKTSQISDYTLSNFVVTEGPNLAVVTYDVTLSETIEGKRLTSKAIRLSVWQNNNGKWQLISHAVLIPVPPPPPSKN